MPIQHPTREEIEKLYETETGLKAWRGQSRIDHLEAFIKDNRLSLSDVAIINDTNKMGRDYRAGIAWYAGMRHADTACLGYTSGRGSFVYKNAIFAQSDKVFQGE